MHLKHYHRELGKKKPFQAPNVADLAYARTVDDHLDNSVTSLPSIEPLTLKKQSPVEGRKMKTRSSKEAVSCIFK